MQKIIGTPTFRRAFNLLEAHGEALASPALLTTAIPLEPFSAPQAKEFLVQEGQPNDRAEGAVDLLKDDQRLFYPGILLQGAFRYDPRLVTVSGENPTSEDLALTIMEHAYDIAQTVVEKLCDSGDCDYQGAMVSLMSMAVFQRASIPAELLSAAELAPIPKEHLLRVGWLESPGGVRLIGFGHHAVRAAAALALSGRKVAGGADELRAALQRLSTVIFKDRGVPASPALDESAARSAGDEPTGSPASASDAGIDA
jgi:hypothetical protein